MTESEGDDTRGRDASSELERLAEALLVNGLPPNERDDPHLDTPGSTMASILRSEKYRGAFIHPDLLKQFDQYIKNGAERAFSLTEREQEHRHAVDVQFLHAQTSLVAAQVEKIKSENQDRRLVIIFSFIFFMAVGVGGFVAIMTDHALGGASVLGGGGLVAIAGILVALARRGQQSKEK